MVFQAVIIWPSSTLVSLLPHLGSRAQTSERSFSRLKASHLLLPSVCTISEASSCPCSSSTTLLHLSCYSTSGSHSLLGATWVGMAMSLSEAPCYSFTVVEHTSSDASNHRSPRQSQAAQERPPRWRTSRHHPASTSSSLPKIRLCLRFASTYIS